MTSEILVQEAPQKAFLQAQLVLLKGQMVFWTNKIVLAKQCWVLTNQRWSYVCWSKAPGSHQFVDLKNFVFSCFSKPVDEVGMVSRHATY